MKYLMLISALFLSACNDEKPKEVAKKPEQNILNQNTDHAQKRVGEMNQKIGENHEAVLKAGE